MKDIKDIKNIKKVKGIKKVKNILFVIAAVLTVSGCAGRSGDGTVAAPEADGKETAAVTSEADGREKTEMPSKEDAEKNTELQDEETQAQPETIAEPCRFQPHVYSERLSEVRDEKWWESFYHLVDALRAGEDAFECSDESTYRQCISSITLGHLYPVACAWVTGESKDGTVPYENGVGRIYYTIPKEEFAAKRDAFENEIDRILGETVKTSDTAFEKCIELYNYVTSHFTYDFEGWPEGLSEGATYRCLTEKKGICCEIGSAYAYLLLQCGVDALEIQSNDDIYHAWTYVLLDAEGYHVDPTWGLHEKDELLTLKYFMETDEERANDGFDTSTLEVPLFLDEKLQYPEGLSFPAGNERYKRLWECYYVNLDKENKVLRYAERYDGRAYEFPYE